MKPDQKIRNVIHIIWAFAILWISLGSLINFHQHHLWRKQLIPEVVASFNKKEKSKVVHSIKQHQENSNDNGIDQSAVPFTSSDSHNHYASVIILLEADGFSDDIAAGLTRSPGLRAPPAA
ncbi:MAG: hypothetical protein AB9842_03525 [Bacteroidales bacterium]